MPHDDEPLGGVLPDGLLRWLGRWVPEAHADATRELEEQIRELYGAPPDPNRYPFWHGVPQTPEGRNEAERRQDVKDEHELRHRGERGGNVLPGVILQGIAAKLWLQKMMENPIAQGVQAPGWDGHEPKPGEVDTWAERGKRNREAPRVDPGTVDTSKPSAWDIGDPTKPDPYAVVHERQAAPQVAAAQAQRARNFTE
jgi:hypothetical protein